MNPQLYKLICLLLFIQTSIVFAQNPNSSHTSSGNRTSMSLDITKTPIDFEFNTYSDYKNGIGGKGSNYTTIAKISSNVNWELCYYAQSSFTSNTGMSVIELNNIGLSTKSPSTPDLVSYAEDESLCLSNNYTILLRGNGKNNNGNNNNSGSTGNIWIYWEMGTQNGNMNPKSILEQNIKSGIYSTEILFILRESI